MKVVIVEDSRLARQGLLRMLMDFPTLEIVGDAEHPIEALELITKTKPDVLFLDIHMPGETGFDLLDKLDYTPHVIFTTAYSEYAYRSFDYNAVDYLLKPISPERLASAINKLSDLVTNEEPHAEPLAYDSKILIKDGDECHLVALSSIRYFESCKNYVRAFFADASSGHAANAYIKKPLNVVNERLPTRHFFRINRQYLVNLSQIQAIDESISDGYDITMSDNQILTVSRRNASELKKQLSL